MVELLVVVAILAVLIALLMPSLHRASYLAKETKCASNLREIAIGLTNYASGNGGWYPKNGATRNEPDSLQDGRYWNLKPLLRPMFGGSLNVFTCPLVEELVEDKTDHNSYKLLFDTRGNRLRTGSIGDGGPDRVLQYDVNGNVCADSSSKSQFQTWYWPNLVEPQLMRRLNQTWTKSKTDQEFNLLAMDRCTGRGHPVRSRQTNHPEPSEIWRKDGTLWRGESHWMPATSVNYLDTGGAVRTYRYVGHRYWVEKMPEPVIGVTGVGYVPEDYRVN